MPFELDQHGRAVTAGRPGELQLEQVTCPLGCERTADEVLHEFGDFGVCRCGGCGLVRLNPRLAEADSGDLYEREYFAGDHATGYDAYERDAHLYEKTFARRLKLIRRFKSGGRVLDIGCSFGYFLNVAQRAGFDVYGLDVSPYAVERAAERFPGRIHQGVLRPGLFPPQFFDVVTMFDLFEHVYRPREFLTTLDEITRADAIVCITTPNHRSVLSRASRRNWVSYKIPEHVFYYTPTTLRRTVAPLFEIALVRSEGQYCTLEFFAERLKTLSHPLGSALVRTVRGLGAKDWPVYVNSGSMTAVLRKTRQPAISQETGGR
jgi:SAM-dependent methyltransferase